MRSRLIYRASLLWLTVICAGFGAGFAGAAQARDPAAPYLGMTQAEIVACAGEPHARYRSGAEAETLTYRYRGEGPVPAEPGAIQRLSDATSDGAVHLGRCERPLPRLT